MKDTRYSCYTTHMADLNEIESKKQLQSTEAQHIIIPTIEGPFSMTAIQEMTGDETTNTIEGVNQQVNAERIPSIPDDITEVVVEDGRVTAQTESPLFQFRSDEHAQLATQRFGQT